MTMSEVQHDDGERSSSGKIEKDALLQLIAQEMVTSLLNGGNDDGDDDDDQILSQLQAKLIEREKARRLKRKARKKSKGKINTAEWGSPTQTTKSSVEDVYYSHVSGTGLPSPPLMPPTPMEVLNPGDDLVMNMKDHDDDDSFAGGELHELVDDKHRRVSMELSSTKMSRSSSGSLEGTTRSTATSSNENSVRSKDLSMEEIRQYVIDNIPLAIREQIPPEAWSQLFNPESMGSKTASQTTAQRNSAKSQKDDTIPLTEIEIDEEDDDNMSVFSDVSGLTGAFPDGRGVENKREILSQSTALLKKVEESGSINSQNSDTYRAPEAPGEHEIFHSNIKQEPKDRLPETIQLQPATSNGPKKISWNQVEVRYYERIVTDNPAVQSGPAIGIGWKYKRGGRVDIDYWEQSRGQPRLSPELVLPRHVRERMLREAGISQKDIAEMIRATLKVRNQRKQTVNNLPAAAIEEAVEKTRRRFSRILSLGKK